MIGLLAVLQLIAPDAMLLEHVRLDSWPWWSTLLVAMSQEAAARAMGRRAVTIGKVLWYVGKHSVSGRIWWRGRET